MIERRYDNRTVQGLLGHASVETTQIYTHVLNKGGRGVRSPIDEEWVGALYGFSIFALRLNLLRTSLFDSVEG